MFFFCGNKARIRNKNERNILHHHTFRSCQISQSGVPRGLILGPILFIALISDVIECEERSSGHLANLKVFADDTNAIISADRVISVQLRVSEALKVFRYYRT